jgi:protein-tyrosine-phosphatase
MAEGFLRDMVTDHRPGSITVGSAGVGAFDGQEPSRNSVIAMQQEGIDISAQRSQQLTPEIVRNATHLFGMSASHRQAIEALYPEAIEKTFILREFIVEDELDLDVPDPIGMDLDAYERTRNLIKEAMPSVLKFVLGSPGADLFPLDNEDDDLSIS